MREYRPFLRGEIIVALASERPKHYSPVIYELMECAAKLHFMTMQNKMQAGRAPVATQNLGLAQSPARDSLVAEMSTKGLARQSSFCAMHTLTVDPALLLSLAREDR